jgi:hypothetical protein
MPPELLGPPGRHSFSGRHFSESCRLRTSGDFSRLATVASPPTRLAALSRRAVLLPGNKLMQIETADNYFTRQVMRCEYFGDGRQILERKLVAQPRAM